MFVTSLDLQLLFVSLIVVFGFTVSNIIVLVILLVVLFQPSLNCIYTVLVPFVLVNVHPVLLAIFVHPLQFVQLLENLIWIGVHASVHVIFVNNTLVPLAYVAPVLILKLQLIGAVVSKIIVLLILFVVFHHPSLNLIYTVFVASEVVNVCDVLALHVVQFVGFVLFPNAICTVAQASVGHVTFKVTLVLFVRAAHPLIVKSQPTGAVVSKIILSLIVAVLWFHALSLYLTLTVFVPSQALHHDQFVIFQLLLVPYVSHALHVVPLQLNCICHTPFVSLADNVNVVFALLVRATHPLILIVPVGAVVSKIIEFVVSLVVFHKLSLNLIYTVLFPSGVANVCHVLLTHVCQLVFGLAVFPNAICTGHHTPLSVGHVIFNVTLVPLAYVLLLFTTKLQPVGALLSILYTCFLNHSVLPALSVL